MEALVKAEVGDSVALFHLFKIHVCFGFGGLFAGIHFLSQSFPNCCGYVWQNFGSKGSTGLASVRSCQKLPPCLTEPMPAGAKMDLLLAKTEPSSNGGSPSGITRLRRKKPCVKGHFAAGERSENSADTEVTEEGGGGAEVPLQPVEQTMVGQAVSLQPMEATPSWSRGMPEGGCDPVGSLRWSRGRV